MSNFMNTYFGPLDKDACMYFYIISVFCGFSFAIVLILTILYVIMNFQKVNRMYLTHAVMASTNLFLAYFVNRLLHTICIRSL